MTGNNEKRCLIIFNYKIEKWRKKLLILSDVQWRVSIMLLGGRILVYSLPRSCRRPVFQVQFTRPIAMTSVTYSSVV